jgi:LysM repeat protein
VAFLLAVTIVVLLVRSGLREGVGTPGGAGVVAVTTGGHVYVAAGGDTLEAIAARLGTTPAELIRLNPGIDPGRLRVGRRLRVK